jgi:MoaA/NifB/PqqE/SkfB family radical SAM enzyme
MHVLERLPILLLYPHSRCNCRCVMCDIWKIDKAEELSPEELERHAADIVALGVEQVVFSGGEPLMHSDLFRLCDRLHALSIRITLLSTGLLLDKHARRIVEGVDAVIVSLDGPPEVHDGIRRVRRAFELLARGVGALRSLRPGFPVAARCTVQRSNALRLRDTVAAAREIGLDSISFLAADLTSDAFNRKDPWSSERQSEVSLDVAGVQALEAEIEALIDDEAGAGTRYVLESPEKLRRIVLHFRAHLGLAEPVAPRCNAPWVSAVVESDGTVRPCFFHAPLGRLGTQSLREVLNGAQAIAFRQSLDVASNPICRRCVCSLHWKG